MIDVEACAEDPCDDFPVRDMAPLDPSHDDDRNCCCELWVGGVVLPVQILLARLNRVVGQVKEEGRCSHGVNDCVGQVDDTVIVVQCGELRPEEERCVQLKHANERDSRVPRVAEAVLA